VDDKRFSMGVLDMTDAARFLDVPRSTFSVGGTPELSRQVIPECGRS
jgi:hypothetical protein